MSRYSQVLFVLALVLALFTFAPMAFSQDAPAPARVAKADPEQPLVKVVALRYANAQQLENVLRQIAGRRRDVTVASDSRTNSILVRGSEKETARIEGMIAALDREIPQPKRQRKPESEIRVIKLQYREANDIRVIINEVFGDTPPRGPRTAGFAASPSTLRVVADFGLNALVIRANDAMMKEIQALIVQLDVEAKPAKKDK